MGDAGAMKDDWRPERYAGERLPGMSARTSAKAGLWCIAFAMACLPVFAVISRNGIPFAGSLLIILTFAIFGAGGAATVLEFTYLRMRKREVAAGYTTISGFGADVIRIDPRTGLIIRRAGETVAAEELRRRRRIIARAS